VLGLLAVANFLNYGTRNVVFTLYDDLRDTFGLTNSELGLLGTVFMAGHALVTVPVGWAADRLDRRRVIAVGVLCWTVANIGSALALGFGSLLISRALAGIGTAACVPVVNALLPDVFAARDKARVVSIFNLGLFLGGAAGFAFGALLGFPLAFVVMAAPGLIVVVLVARLDVPPRRPGVGHLPVTLGAFQRDLATLLRLRTMRWLLLGAILMAFAAGGLVAWFADFVARVKGMGLDEATAIFGACAVTGGLLGVLTGGVVGDRLQARLPYGRMAAMSIGFALSIPFLVAALLVPAGPVFIAVTWATMFFITWYHGPMAAVVDDLVPPSQAATSQAAFIFTMHLLGTAPSSYVVGLLADDVGLTRALLAPVVAIGLASLAIAAGFRHVERDCAITHRS
jgi:predicted MFS family arabinose efflux permease